MLTSAHKQVEDLLTSVPIKNMELPGKAPEIWVHISPLYFCCYLYLTFYLLTFLEIYYALLENVLHASQARN